MVQVQLQKLNLLLDFVVPFAGLLTVEFLTQAIDLLLGFHNLVVDPVSLFLSDALAFPGFETQGKDQTIFHVFDSVTLIRYNIF